jgi:hypothetical protein
MARFRSLWPAQIQIFLPSDIMRPPFCVAMPERTIIAHLDSSLSRHTVHTTVPDGLIERDVAKTVWAMIE